MYRIVSKVVVWFAKFTIRIVSRGERIVSPLPYTEEVIVPLYSSSTKSKGMYVYS